MVLGQLVRAAESRALRHAFFAERAATKLADVPEDTPARRIETAAVIGAGTMGAGIAMSLANAGLPVALLEVKADALERGVATLRKNYEASASKGKLTAAQVQERMALIRPTMAYADVAQADLVIEAVFETMSVKEGVFRKLDAVMKKGAILATNTSTLDVDRIAAFTSRPQDVVGLHFFSPANVMRLLEIVRGAATAKDVLASALALAKRIRKVSVVSRVCYGFIGNRMIEQYHRQAIALLEEGALPQQVDGALERWGMAMGVFRMSDLAGNDVGWLIRKDRLAHDPEHARLWTLSDRLCELGRFGQKTGAGWYRYEAGRRDALPDPAVEALIVGHSRERGLTRRTIGDEEIVQRCVLALTNEGARILEEGVAQRASDVDLVYLTGYGFPRHRGGPMFHADVLGLDRVLRLMRGFAASPNGRAEEAWAPAPLLKRLAREGRAFTS